MKPSELIEIAITEAEATTSRRKTRKKAKNGDDYIDLKEFEEFNCYGDVNGEGSGTGGEKELRDAFDLYDLDKNGVISASELHAVMKKLEEKCSMSDCRRMIKSVDAVVRRQEEDGGDWLHSPECGEGKVERRPKKE